MLLSRFLLRSFFYFFICCLAPNSFAQLVDAPPKIYVLDENNVTIPDGRFIITQKDLEIGPVGHGGLEFIRYINDGVRRTNLLWDLAILHSQGNGGRAIVATFGNESDRFYSANGSDIDNLKSIDGTGALLSIVGSNPILYKRDGTKIVYSPARISAALNSSTFVPITADFPSGEKWTWYWKIDNKGTILQGVENNFGYAVKLAFQTNGTYVLKNVTAFNKAFEYCDLTADECNFVLPWPQVTFSQTVSKTESVETIVAPTNKQIKNSFRFDNSINVKSPSNTDYNTAFWFQKLYDCPSDLDVVMVKAVVKNGKTWNYLFNHPSFDCSPYRDSTLTVQNPLGKETTYTFIPSGTFYDGSPANYRAALGGSAELKTKRDAEGHITQYEWDDYHRIKKLTMPEGDSWEFFYDSRGNLLQQVRHAKPSSGNPDIVQLLQDYTPTCSNLKTCNKPNSITDARGKATFYEYDPIHGGITKETLPELNGVNPVKRFIYIQRSARIKNASGSYESTSPIWVLSEERTCRTSQTIDNGCAAGTSDEIVTGYDYGSYDGPNNLLLKGITIKADNVLKRICFGYDQNGRKVYETAANAGLSSCGN